MATINAQVSTNNGNFVLYSYSTKLAFHTAFAVSTFARHDEVESVENLGVGVTDTTTGLFTNLT